MSTGTDADNSTVVSMTLCSCQLPLPAFLVVKSRNALKTSVVLPAFPGLAEADISLSSSSDGSVPNIVQKLLPVWVPYFVNVVPQVKSMSPPPTVIQSLHQFKADIVAMEITAVDNYECLQVSTVKLSPCMPS